MLALELEIGGRRLVTAGVEDGSLVSFVVSCGRWRGEDDLHIHLGGVTSGQPGEHVRWTPPPLTIGGPAIAVRVVEADRADPPEQRFASDPASMLRATVTQREDRYQQYLALKAEFEPTES